MNQAELEQATAGLLAAAGLKGEFALGAIAGSANNRVFRVELKDSTAFLKEYYRHPGDSRDRLGTEFAFARFAWGSGMRALAQPLASDPKHSLGLYEFIEGRSLSPREISEDEVRQASAFYADLNRHKRQPAAEALPEASEAFFSLNGHLSGVQRRLDRLGELEGPAGAFVREELLAAWDEIRGSFMPKAKGLPDEIAREDRVLSPSDFGFHNSLLARDGRLRFFDFEYAGWDDPAKFVCDFFCQPRIPAPMPHFAAFAEAAVSGLSRPDLHRRRIDLLLPVYRIKWCCILLNEFLPLGSDRRRFAGHGEDESQRKALQLAKAREMLRSLARVPR